MNKITTRAKSFGGVLLLGLWYLVGIAVTGLILFLINLGADYFYEIVRWTPSLGQDRGYTKIGFRCPRDT